ncbi:MAG: hypothetical protein HBSAPP03_03260 [Phycisphaerae bacterium]|nr:MAG: hypothetical protein HBSAPP03_03260 [Phycisphaerae bacterium]
MPSRNYIPVLIASASLALTAFSFAQVPSTPPSLPPDAQGTVEFEQEPFRLDAVGLTLFLPLGSTAEAGTMPGKTTVRVKPADNAWIANIQNPRTSNQDLTASKVLEDMVTQLLKQSGEVYERGRPDRPLGYRGVVLLPSETRVIDGRPAQRAYVKLPAEGSSAAIVRGYYVFQLSPAQFVTFELITTEPALTNARRDFEAMVSSARFEDPAKANADRSTAIQTGQKILQRISETTMREIVEAAPERWERLFRPSPTGAKKDDEEIGYRRVRASIGRRGDLDPTRKNPGPGDRQPGYVVRLDARYLDKSGGVARTIDSQAIYFLTFDRESEAWNVRNAIRAGTTTDVVSEIGARQGASMTVEITPAKGAGRTVRPLIQGDGYISRVESMLLPQIMMRAGITAEAGFYAYQSESETIRLRRDILEQPIDRPGMWRLITRFSETQPPQTSVYNAAFDLIRSELPRGVVAEPITLEELGALWRAKGLPMK